MIPTDTSADPMLVLPPPAPLRYRSRPFLRHLLIAGISAVLPLMLILSGLGIDFLNHSSYAHPGLSSIARGIATTGAYMIPLSLVALLGLLSMVAELQELDRRERWALRLAILFMILGLFISPVLAYVLFS